METLILCLVSLAFLLWVLILKHQLEWQKRENQQLRERLGRHAQLMTRGVEVSDGRRLTKSEIALADHKALQGKTTGTGRQK